MRHVPTGYKEIQGRQGPLLLEHGGERARRSPRLPYRPRRSRAADKRGDCLQVVVALVLTPDGFPLAYEVMPGNTSDKETQMPFIRRLEEKYGRIVTLPRYVEPKPDLAILLDRLGLTLPAQPPPKISCEVADAAKSTV